MCVGRDNRACGLTWGHSWTLLDGEECPRRGPLWMGRPTLIRRNFAQLLTHHSDKRGESFVRPTNAPSASLTAFDSSERVGTRLSYFLNDVTSQQSEERGFACFSLDIDCSL